MKDKLSYNLCIDTLIMLSGQDVEKAHSAFIALADYIDEEYGTELNIQYTSWSESQKVPCVPTDCNTCEYYVDGNSSNSICINCDYDDTSGWEYVPVTVFGYQRGSKIITAEEIRSILDKL